MNVPVQITVQSDTATPALLAKLKACDPHVLATRLAVPLARHWRDHLKALPQNKKGYPSSGFWEDAARRVVGIAQEGNVLLYSDKLGLRQRLYGGTIAAVNVKNLTIPICAEAYGTKAADWGDNLVLVVFLDTGKKFLALWLGEDDAQSRYQATVGAAIAKYNKGRKAGKLQVHASERTTRAARKFGAGSSDHPKVMFFKKSSGGTQARTEKHANLKFLFVLVKSVEQAGNQNVIPLDLSEVAAEELRKALN